MTERRPHWDDELIDTVRSHFYENGFVEEVFGVIAAVEDWQATQFVELPAQPYECDAAEAAIQRVRELADTWMSDGAAWGPYSARCILDALDGGAQPAKGRFGKPETKGLDDD